MVYIWSIPESYPDKFIGSYEYKKSPDYLIFSNGAPITALTELPIITFDCSKNKLLKYDCLVNSSLLPLINKKLCKIFDDICPNDVQYFDVNIQCKDGALEDYKLLNVTQKVEAIDHNRTEFKYLSEEKGEFFGFKYLVLHQNCLEKSGVEIARNSEYTPHILVNQTLHDAFKAEKITGVRLITVDEFNEG